MSGTTTPMLPAQVSIVVPILNERDNVGILVDRLRALLDGLAWEIVFVDDDSKDGTGGVLRELARQDPRVRGLRRVGRRGLSSACIEGVLATSAPYVVIMDGDLQHDETILPRMVAALRGGADLVVGSRYTGSGGVGDWDARRAWMSRFATRLSAMVNKCNLSDPMSGFFGFTRELFDEALPRLSGLGFKLLLDMCSSVDRKLTVVEEPYGFRSRAHGESKLDSLVAWEFLMLLADKSFGRVIPARFLAFMLVGGSGVFVHMAALWTLLAVADLSFAAAQTGASFVAMTSNFALNNALTYRDRRLTGRRLVLGLLSFYAVCSAGTVANVGAASYLFGTAQQSWWLSGFAGVVIGSVWNYAMTSIFTWRK
ncbi:glycosyltransferase family 2 protein [Alsobacter sp. SYSU M60028]|uniref:Glycosyltransferase family 2 protein n=1 Tax=Alsobacter ponti TaxID=2962936 RepID=A0ABT1L8R5_9HYPH|nr:glycosyltransferase family 2 protein [Alsobacter ponti]MCP8937874.1 glycosyltransferase family 2 protein [Alsobacter ponti]